MSSILVIPVFASTVTTHDNIKYLNIIGSFSCTKIIKTYRRSTRYKNPFCDLSIL
jgi:hypothetical protein